VKWLRRLGVGLLVAVTLSVLGHFALRWWARPIPPEITFSSQPELVNDGAFSSFGASWSLQRSALREVHLAGTPADIGLAHGRLLREGSLAAEGALYADLNRRIPSRLLRTVLFDAAQLRFHDVAAGFSAERRAELAGQAVGMQPDPYAGLFPTYQRLVYLNAVYDMALSFEHSPLVGCTTFTLKSEATSSHHTLLARNFDFELDELFDRSKAVFFVSETGKLPYATVTWPGLIGAFSGMNLEGVAIVVHGARAGQPASRGEPVPHAMRRVLESCHSTEEAVAALSRESPMVSHVVIVADAQDDVRVLERVPGMAPFVYALGPRAVVTNHLVGPSARDPKNLQVMASTSTLARRGRGEQLLQRLAPEVELQDVVALLRERRGVDDVPLQLGDRRAIDALLAAHGVVMDTTARVLWVSEAPHLLGRFVAFDLRAHFAPEYQPHTDEPLPNLPADPLLTSGDYERWRRGGGAWSNEQGQPPAPPATLQ